MEISTFAPVIIPTLNRYDHFRRCVESLSRCTHAEKTELIIGIDYPPSDKYVEGWKMINEYVPTITGFKKVTVFRHEMNMGQAGNNKVLYKYAKQYYDRFIESEDDNVFAPSFLDFVNKCLKEYENDTKVKNISGYTHPFFYDDDKSLVFSYDNSGWGCGYWLNKELERGRIHKDYYRNILFSVKKSYKLFVNYPLLLSNLLSMVRGGKTYGDTTRTCYNILNDTYQIRPYKSLVRNIGIDGTGLHCDPRDQKFFENQELLEDTEYLFEKQEPKLSVSKWRMWKFSLKPNTLEKLRIILASFYFYVKFRLQNKKEA